MEKERKMKQKSLPPGAMGAILVKHKRWLFGEPGGERADLSGADLRNEDLYGAYLARSDLSGANLDGACLRGADLSEANLRRTSFVGADLQCAQLLGSEAHQADFRGADLRGADLDFASFSLWCGSFDAKVSRSLAAQLAYHFCRLDCSDPDYLQARAALAALANSSDLVTGPEMEIKL